MSDYEEERLDIFYVYCCPVMTTARKSMNLARSFWGKPEAKQLVVLEAELKWHSANPKGELKEVSRLALEIHNLESILFDMVESETNTVIPEGI